MKTPLPTARRWAGPPLMLQILALLIGGLVVAQLVTLFLTLVLPPVATPRFRLDAVAGALRGGESADLDRSIQSGPPDLSGPGWVVSQRAKERLAAMLGAAPTDVRLAFFSPPPFAGSTPVPGEAAEFFLLFQGRGGGGFGFGRGPRFPVGAERRRGSCDGMGSMGRPPDIGSGRGSGSGSGSWALRSPRGMHSSEIWGERPGLVVLGRRGGAFEGDPRGGAMALYAQGGAPDPSPQPVAPMPFSWSMPAGSAAAAPRVEPPPEPARTEEQPAPQPARPAARAEPLPVPTTTPAAALAPPPRQPAGQLAGRPEPAPPASDIRSGASEPAGLGAMVPAPQRPSSLFGLAPAPEVQGLFIAALRLPDGRWAVVQPTPEPFPNSWQRRVLLWFAIAFAIVAPAGLLFARRIVRPLTAFADAAERLGRDPSAVTEDLDGPAELGRAARAFTIMQSRLKSYVEDRTAMIGAISHDLRTPLTRLRFRMEEVEDEHVREGMAAEVAEMEAMITSVLTFIRNASLPGARERLDLGLLVEDVVEDAAIVGGNVTVEAVAPAPVEVDPLGMRRVLQNLIDNAVKYGSRARVRLSVERGEAVAEVIDAGPGIPEEDLERAFEPFYRAPAALHSEASGTGLGLAVCRSIARAHGGDVTLVNGRDGLTAQLRLPLTLAPEFA